MPDISRAADAEPLRLHRGKPEYQEIADARNADAFVLQFNPRQSNFRSHPFRRAAEGAAWLEVERSLNACGPMEHPHDALFTDDDNLRAAMLRAIGPGSREGEADEAADNGMGVADRQP